MESSALFEIGCNRPTCNDGGTDLILLRDFVDLLVLLRRIPMTNAAGQGGVVSFSQAPLPVQLGGAGIGQSVGEILHGPGAVEAVDVIAQGGIDHHQDPRRRQKEHKQDALSAVQWNPLLSKSRGTEAPRSRIN